MTLDQITIICDNIVTPEYKDQLDIEFNNHIIVNNLLGYCFKRPLTLIEQYAYIASY